MGGQDQGLGVAVWGSGSRDWDAGFGVWSSAFGFGVEGWGLRDECVGSQPPILAEAAPTLQVWFRGCGSGLPTETNIESRSPQSNSGPSIY